MLNNELLRRVDEIRVLANSRKLALDILIKPKTREKLTSFIILKISVNFLMERACSND